MTAPQIIASYIGVLITSTIIFFVLRAISVVFLERKQKNYFLKTNENATSQEIDADFRKYFKTVKIKLYVAIIIMVIIIYIIIRK